MRILFLGDIVGRPGRTAVKNELAAVRADEGVDFIIANGENASGGLGLSAKSARELLGAGVDVLTGGNHIWKFRDLPGMMVSEQRLLRPANYPEGAPGRGWAVYRPEGLPPVAVLNLQGRTYMQETDCPFRTAEAVLAGLPEDAAIRVVDFHAEATSEKKAMGWFLDGRCSAVLGTHTHVQTADARILPGGTGYLTDAGMCGSQDSCLGVKSEIIIRKFLTGLPQRFEVAAANVVLQGAIFELDDSTGRATSFRLWERPCR